MKNKSGKRHIRYFIIIFLILAILYWTAVNVLVSAVLVPSFMEKLEAFERISEQSYAEQVQASELQQNASAMNLIGRTWAQNADREEVEVISEDGYRLNGVIFRPQSAKEQAGSEDSHHWAVLLHGYTGSKEMMYSYALRYVRDGYRVLTPDFRCQGESEGDYIGLGATDSRDLLKWIELILERDPEAGIVLHGLSMGASAALLMAPDRTDIYVMTDGCHGSSERTVEEEMAVRRRQFEAEMEYVKPHAWHWLGIEDTKLKEENDISDKIDFTKYTKVFMPELESTHPDHVAATQLCCDAIRRQEAKPECYSYEIFTPFHEPSHYIDITGLEEEKSKLIRCHKDQGKQEQIAIALNAFRASQMIFHDYKYVECFKSIDPYSRPDTPDILFKLYELEDDPEAFARLERNGIEIKRVMPMDITKVYEFIRDNFARAWADEALPALINGDCHVAVRGREILAFHTIDTPAKGFMGPTGVIPEARRNGILRALTINGLKAMKAKGYKYVVFGMTHPRSSNMIKKMPGAVVIPSSAGAYNDKI